MSDAPPGKEPGRLGRCLILLAGLILGQAILYGPSLAGYKVLLPLDILAQPDIYLPQTAETRRIEPQMGSLTDLVYVMEPQRRFAVSELRSGRLPMWTPYGYGGAPFLWAKFSPFMVLECCTASPVVLAWVQLAAALVGGIGAYVFFRRVLAVGFWPAAMCGWCYPLTGFFVFWQGYPTGFAVYWLPWILLAVDRTTRGSGALASVGLTLVTCLAMVSGQPDVGCQVLLASGLYGLWRLVEVWRNPDAAGQVRRTVMKLSWCWALGLLLAMPYLLPLFEYSRTGARMALRSSGQEERPPVGLKALPQVVLPDIYGRMKTGSLHFGPGHQNESAAAGYAGVIAALLVAPLAFCSRRHRAINCFWVGLGILGLSWCLNVPVVVNLLRLPGLNILSHNRMVFMTAFAVLALAAVGLEALMQGQFLWQRWMWGPAVVLAGLCAWCAYRSTDLPEPIKTQLVEAVAKGSQVGWIHDLEGVKRVQAWFIRYYSACAVWCGLGALGWVWLRSRGSSAPRLVPLLGLLLAGDLVSFAWGRSVQCDPALYYPSNPVLEAVARAPVSRIMGFGCLPANLSAMCGLRDIRGYDAVDPARMTELLTLSADPGSARTAFARTLQLAPKAKISAAGNIELPPILDMLGVGYVIFRGLPTPNTRPVFQGPDYWVLANPAALPRVFVPHRIEVMTNSAARLEKLTSPQFDPRQVAYVESPLALPAECRGAADLVEETPTRIVISWRMQTPGLVVLADLWDAGWRAYVNGVRVPIFRTNHAIRGVPLPAGTGRLEFRYQPASFALGLTLAGLAAVMLLGVTAINCRRGQTPR